MNEDDRTLAIYMSNNPSLFKSMILTPEDQINGFGFETLDSLVIFLELRVLLDMIGIVIILTALYI